MKLLRPEECSGDGTVPEGMDRRTATARQLQALTPSVEDLLSDEIDGVRYYYKRVANCKVCQLPGPLMQIADQLLVSGNTYTQILKLLIPLFEEAGLEQKKWPSYDSIRGHSKRHLPHEKAALRELAERHAAKQNRPIMDGVENIITAEAFFELVGQRTWNGLANKTLAPSLKEGMEAWRVIAQMKKESEGEVSIVDLLSQLDIIISAMKEVCPPEMLARISAEIERQRLLRQREGHWEDEQEGVMEVASATT